MCFQKRGIYRTKNARAHETSTILCLTCYVGHRPVPKTEAVKMFFFWELVETHAFSNLVESRGSSTLLNRHCTSRLLHSSDVAF